MIGKEGKASFSRKRSKKLSSVRICHSVGSLPPAGTNLQEFFGSFFQKRTSSLDFMKAKPHG
jgi:hypothetical protein